MSLDDEIRALERAVIAGDEALRPRLEAIYARTGAEGVLEDRLVAHVGPWRPCRACNGRGSSRRMIPVESGPESGPEFSRVESVPCQSCDGTALTGPLRYARRVLGNDYAGMKRRGGAHVYQVSYGGLVGRGSSPYGQRSEDDRGWISLSSEETCLIASVDAADWIAHQMLTNWANDLPKSQGRVGARFGSIVRTPRPHHVKTLRDRFHAEEFSGPQVAWWSGATEPRPPSTEPFESKPIDFEAVRRLPARTNQHPARRHREDPPIGTNVDGDTT